MPEEGEKNKKKDEVPDLAEGDEKEPTTEVPTVALVGATREMRL